MGTFAPDIEYFLRLAPGGGWGHTIPGAFGLSLPLGLITLWLFHGYLKLPATLLLPDSWQRRLEPGLHPFRFGGLRRFAVIVLSLLVGIATHLVWDQFTHDGSWAFHHWHLLREGFHLRMVGWIRYAEILQWVSSVAGLLILAVWLMRWYRRARPAAEPVVRTISPAHKLTIVGLMALVAVLGGVLRAYLGSFTPHDASPLAIFVDQTIVTFIAIFWWELIGWGILLRPRFPHSAASSASRSLGPSTRDVA
jgi:hypothetical protein